MSSRPLALVFDYRETAKYALNVLAGALDTDPETRDVPIDFVPRSRTLESAIAARLAAQHRVLVAWSFFSAGLPAAAERLSAVRAVVSRPDVLHVAGGVHATADPRGTLEAGFDLAAEGEGERTIVELVRALVRGEDPREVRGVASLDTTGAFRSRGKGEFVDLDAWPPFAPSHNRLGPIEITRGCLYACKFCQTPFMNRARFRHRTLDEIRRWTRVQADRGFRDFRFISPTSLSYGSQDEDPRLEIIEDLLSSVRAIIGADRRLFFGTFPSEIRPEHVSPRALAILRRWVDNDSLILGGQSGSARVLEKSHRGHGPEVIERAAAYALEAGFVPHVDFIFGLPGEGPEEAAETLAMMERLAGMGAMVHGHAFMPLPGTPFRDEAPGEIAPETRRAIERLASRGRLYGQWKSQLAIARALADRRRATRSAQAARAARAPRS